MPNWKSGFDPALVVARLEEITNRSDSGKVSFTGFEYSELKVLFNTMIEVDEKVPEIAKQGLIRSAIVRAAERGPISPRTLIAEVCKQENKYFKKPFERFRLLTSISFSPFCEVPRFVFEGSHIVVNAKSTLIEKKGRDEILKTATRSLGGKLPNDYVRLSTSVQARSPHEAADLALWRLDFVRGIWNLWNNRGRHFRWSSGERKPVNQIVLGPVHTLHEQNGNLATDSWWYEPQYQGPIARFNSPNNIEHMVKFTENFRMHYRKSKYPSDIVEAVVRYVRALDSSDWQDSFLRLWGVLELLTGTQTDNYKVTIRRAAYMFAERDYSFQILSHLRDQRNRIVHAGTAPNDVESLMYQVKRYVEQLIQFHLGNAFRFESIADAAEFMDLPNDTKQIEKKIDKLTFAKSWLSE
jgi:hypothetical protein